MDMNHEQSGPAGLLRAIDEANGNGLDYIGGLLGVRRTATVTVDYSRPGLAIGTYSDVETDADYRERLIDRVCTCRNGMHVLGRDRAAWPLCQCKAAMVSGAGPFREITAERSCYNCGTQDKLSEYTELVWRAAAGVDAMTFHACAGHSSAAMKRCADASAAYQVKLAVAAAEAIGCKPGTRAHIVTALGRLPGVKDAELHDCQTDAFLENFQVAVVVDGGEPEHIAGVLYEGLPAGLTTLGGTSGWYEPELYEARWFTSPQWDDWKTGAPARDLQRFPVCPSGAHRIMGRPDDCHCGKTPADPLDIEYDGVTLRTLLVRDANGRREVLGSPAIGGKFTTAQRAGVSAHWSARLRARVAESEAADKAREVRVVLDCAEDL